MKIWIVHGSTGEYSDRMEWIVEAHVTEEAAHARVKRLTELLQGMGSYDTWDRRKAMEKAMREHPEGDPRCDIDYTGTSWYLSECELRTNVPNSGADHPREG